MTKETTMTPEEEAIQKKIEDSRRSDFVELQEVCSEEALNSALHD